MSSSKNTPGKNANINGSKFETIVYKILEHKIRKNYQLDEVSRNDNGIIQYCHLLKDGKIYCIYSSQSKFNNKFLKSRNLDPNKIYHQKEPDGFFYYPESNSSFVLEIKSQKSDGSVSEKPGAAPYFVFQYEKILQNLNCDVKMFWCLDEFFNTLEFENCTSEWLSIHNIGYYIGTNFPLEMVGIEEPIKSSKEEIDKIINECNDKFNEDQQEVIEKNKKKKLQIEKDCDGLSLF